MASSVMGNLGQATKHEIFTYAGQLEQSFAEINTSLDQLDPANQVEYVESLQKSCGSFPVEDLQILQARVKDTYQKNRGAIPDVSQMDLGLISQRLKNAEKHLNSILENKTLAEQILNLSKAVQETFQENKTVNSGDVELYKGRIMQLSSGGDIISPGNSINDGNWNVIQKMMTTISRVTVEQDQQPSFLDQNSSPDVQESDDKPWDPEEQALLDKIVALTTSKKPKDQEKLQKIKDILNEGQVPQTLSPKEPQTRSSSIEELQNLLPFFREGANLTAAVQRWEEIECGGIEFHSILQSICFHMYYIHKIEAPRALKNDLNYGKNAMIGVHPATNADRRRAIQRTIVEAALLQLEAGVSPNQMGDIDEALRTLESLPMDAKDMPPGQNNLAYILFGKMYHEHLEARKSNSSLVDPHHGKFNGDFGRNAFKMAEGINPTVKIAVINELHQTLKQVWKI